MGKPLFTSLINLPFAALSGESTEGAKINQNTKKAKARTMPIPMAESKSDNIFQSPCDKPECVLLNRCFLSYHFPIFVTKRSHVNHSSPLDSWPVGLTVHLSPFPSFVTFSKGLRSPNVKI
jgi:hypothetical protein